MSLETAVFGKALLPMAYRALGDSRLRRLAECSARDAWDGDRLDAYQLERLRALLDHASRHVPYYRDLFRDIRFDVRSVRSPADLGVLPPLSRETIRAHPARFESAAFDSSEIRRGSTGGSTGSPMHYVHTLRYLDISTGAAYRQRTWAGWSPGARMAWIWGAPQEVDVWRTTWGRLKSWTERSLRCDAFSAGEAERSEWLRRLRRFRPAFVYGYATSLAHFAQFVRRSGEPIAGVRGVISTAEALGPEQRAAIEAAFGAPVYDHYGSREIKAIAAQCRHGGMHLSSDLNVVEAEAPDSPGSPLLVTSLENYAMPLIRYRIGDVGGLDRHACPCGMPYPLLSLTIGRETDMFVTPEGRELHGEYFTHLMYGIRGIESFQFHQTSPSRIALRVVPGAEFDATSRSSLETVRATVHRDISARIEVDLLLVDDIQPGPTGKHRFTMSDVGPETRSAPRGHA
jgi:phenylacetate-CoA ligase